MFLTAIVFLAILSILVFVHELGHFLVARRVGVAVEEFGLGLPPRAIGKKIKGTIYSLNWLPIGGFVKLAGEDDDSKRLILGKGSTFKHYFWARSKKERTAILLAGVTMNFLVAVGITAYLLTGGVKEPSGRVHVERVVAGSPAEAAGIMIGDIIVSVRETAATVVPRRITTPQELITLTKANAGRPMTMTIIRGEQEIPIIVTPRTDPPPSEGPVGIAISDLEEKRYPWYQAPWIATKINVSRGWEMLRGLGVTLWKLVTFTPIGAEVAGPIGIAQVTGQAVKFGWKAVLEFMSILSLNLAVLNILPIPALDGGRLAFVFLEKVLGKRVKPAFEKSTHQIGMIILLFLVLLVSINDILRLARGG